MSDAELNFYSPRMPNSSIRKRHPGAYDLFRGTRAPFCRASESPIAIACLRLLTVPPLPPRPDFKVPRFLLRIALATVLPAPLLYRVRPVFFLDRFVAAIRFSSY